MQDVVMTGVSSSNIYAVGYDKEKKELFVEFHSGSVYTYFNVPEDIYDGLVSAGSVGKYFNAHVKDQFTFSN